MIISINMYAIFLQVAN